MKTHTLGATAPLNGYIKPTTSFVQIELESGLLVATSVADVQPIESNDAGQSLDFANHDAFSGNPFDENTNDYITK